MQGDGRLWRGQSPSSPKDSMWHAAQYIYYGSRQCACMPWVILFLQKFIPRKKFWEASYKSERVCPVGCQGCPIAEEVYPKETFDVVALTIHVHCNSLKAVLTEENKAARLLIVLHFCDPLDLMKYHDMHDQIHLDENWFFLTWEKEIYLLLPEEKNPKMMC